MGSVVVVGEEGGVRSSSTHFRSDLVTNRPQGEIGECGLGGGGGGGGGEKGPRGEEGPVGEQ